MDDEHDIEEAMYVLVNTRRINDHQDTLTHVCETAIEHSIGGDAPHLLLKENERVMHLLERNAVNPDRVGLIPNEDLKLLLRFSKAFGVAMEQHREVMGEAPVRLQQLADDIWAHRQPPLFGRGWDGYSEAARRHRPTG